MKAILIDPVAKTITQVDYTGPYKQIYTFLTDEAHGIKCDCFETIRLDDNEPVSNSIFVDEEGLLNEPKYFFKLNTYPQPIAGRGLVLGCDEEGETVATSLSVEDVAPRITFHRLGVGGMETTEGKTDHPIAGPNTTYISSRPIFTMPKLDAGEPLDMYAVYNSPKDHPGKFVVRKWRVQGAGGSDVDLLAAENASVVDTLEEARKAIPPGLICFGRDPRDEPQIVETWM